MKGTWSVGDPIVHPVRGPGVVRLVQFDRIRVVWDRESLETWVSVR